MNSAVKMLENKLLLLGPSLTITPKLEARAYGAEPPYSPVRDVKVLKKDFEFSRIPVEITTTSAYNEVKTLSLRRRMKN